MKEQFLPIPFSVFRRDRLIQLEEGIQNVNYFESMMKKGNCDVLFTGDPDDERQIDRTVIKMMKYGLTAIVKELKDEGLQDIASQIIFSNKK